MMLKTHIAHRWADAFHQYETVLMFAQQIRAAYLMASQEQGKAPHSAKSEVQLRLHARACTVFSEILLLLRSGYAAGAWARWRTLHEHEVTMNFLGSSGEATSRRFLDFEIVDRKRELNKLIGLEMPSDLPAEEQEYIKSVQREYSRVREKYGQAFTKSYGWAHQALGKSKKQQVHFSDIELAVGRDDRRLAYQNASYAVHAAPSQLAGEDLILPELDGIADGPSSADLSVPAIMSLQAFQYVNHGFLYLKASPSSVNLVSICIVGGLCARALSTFQSLATINQESKKTH